MLDVRRLRVLREVAIRGSLTAAADALSFSQPAISNQIAKLEQETGTRLIERGQRGVRLTGAGQLLVRHAEVILDRLALAETELGELLDVRRGRLRLGAFPSSFVDLVSRALADFRMVHPGIDVSLRELRLEDAVERLEGGQLDLAVTFEYDIALSSDAAELPRVDLLEDPVYLLLAADHPLAERPRLALADLRDEPWVQFTQGGWASRAIVRAFHTAGYDPRVVLETVDLLAVQGLVAAGVGITLVPGMALPALRPDLVVRSLSPTPATRRVFALWPSSGLSPSAAAMLTVLQGEADHLRAELDDQRAAAAG